MNAMQRFKEQSGKQFPTYADVLKVAATLGYRRVVIESEHGWHGPETPEPSVVHPSTIEA
jgi:hypothetical protein